MRVRFRAPELATLPRDEAIYVSPQQLFLSLDKTYVVHAVSVYDHIVFVQIVDDLDTPVFKPRVLFEMVESGVPRDWICNVFADGPVQMILGPSYVAKDLDSYNAMIDQRIAQVEQFWRRVDSKADEPDCDIGDGLDPTRGEDVLS